MSGQPQSYLSLNRKQLAVKHHGMNVEVAGQAESIENCRRVVRTSAQ
jgi:hypothetical protein